MKIKSYIAQPHDGLYKLDEKASHKYYCFPFVYR